MKARSLTPPMKAVLAAGGQADLARALKISPQAVQQWVEAERIPLKRILQVEQATGVSRSELCPNFYPA
jgi:DNA-binding transcriptional regulator YdaS (Cro superfamily)